MHEAIEQKALNALKSNIVIPKNENNLISNLFVNHTVRDFNRIMV